jgi:hypothetical protein
MKLHAPTLKLQICLQLFVYTSKQMQTSRSINRCRKLTTETAKNSLSWGAKLYALTFKTSNFSSTVCLHMQADADKQVN